MQIVIIGMGALGTEIAQAAAMSGDPVLLHDTDEPALRRALAHISRRIDREVQRGRLDAARARRARRSFTISTDAARCAGADLVIEAIEDRFPLKRGLLQALDAILTPDAILATSTNVLSITALAAATRHPRRVIGLHFFRPAHLMGAVEVVRGPATRPDAVDRAVELLRRMDKTPLAVEDTPGQVVNRIALAYFGEALHLLDDGLDEPTVDRLMEAAGFPLGPFRLMDTLGVDKVLELSQSVYEATFQSARYRPHPRQRRLVEAGRLGAHSARGGFYPKESDT
jgi:3-hydroxybutyryl-CoA dehydrogenase